MPVSPGSQVISTEEARRILGITAIGLSDEVIRRLVVNVDKLTDIVVNLALDSKIQSSIDIAEGSIHTDD